MTNILISVFIVFLISIALSAFMIYRNEVAYKNHIIIINAIGDYKMACLKAFEFNAADLVGYDDVEAYEKTIFRFWDRGYENILPPEKFKLVEPYIWRE